MDCYCFAPNQTFFKCLIYSDLLKKLKIFSTFIWISTGNLNLLKSYIDALYSFGDSAVIRLKKRQNWEEVAKLR